MAENESNDLMSFVSALKGGDVLRVEESLGSGFVRLRVAEAERRQAKHDIRCVEDAVIEMLRNARDAGCERVFVASSREGHMRTVTMIDDGSGIPGEMYDLVFDARVTTKLDTLRMDAWGIHGRGMALYSIRENADSAKVRWSEIGVGTAIEVMFDTNAIKERAEQSAWPTVHREKGRQVVRGPRNIIRACVEFALESKDECRVYFGSPSEMIATMRELSRHESGERMSPMSLFAYADSAREVRDAAESIGIGLSERTAHRIVVGEIHPVRNVLQGLSQKVGKVTSETNRSDGHRRIVLSAEDATRFSEELVSAFSFIENRYYVELVGEPKVRVRNGSVFVEFVFSDDD